MRTSIVIPTYNGERYIGEALESVFAQTTRPDEIVVVDDCSTDATPTVVEGFSRRSPVPLRLLRLERNSGSPARPTNVGVAATSGDAILVLDQDDVLVQESLRMHQAALDECPEAGFSCVLAAYLHEPDRIVRPQIVVADLIQAGGRREQSILIPSAAALRLAHRHGNFAVGFPGFMFRRSAWSKCGPIPEHLRIAGDTRTICSLTSIAPVAFVPKIGYLRREHADNLCKNELRMYAEHAEVLLESRQSNPYLREDADLRHALIVELRDNSYNLRNAGEYGKALRMWFMGMRDLGVTRGAVLDLSTIVAHAIARVTGTLFLARRVSRHCNR